MPKVYFASDHAGFAMKQALIEHLGASGYEVEDMGAHALDPDDDYPDFITPCATRVAAEEGALGIILGGSGQGEAMCANRISGARAVVFYGQIPADAPLDVEGGHSKDGFDIVRLGRKHNNANLLSLAARFVSGEDALAAVRIFLETPFSLDERHVRRLAKF